MRNIEPDSKYFFKSLDFLSIPCQNPQKPFQNCTTYLLCGFLRNWSVIISMLCGHKIALSSHRCHFKAIGSWKVLFKPQLHVAHEIYSAISDVLEPLRAGVRAVFVRQANCMKM